MHAIMPHLLSEGDLIGLLSPCHIGDKAKAPLVCGTLASMGYRVKFSEHLFDDDWGYAASARKRASDFNDLIADPSVKMLFFGGGEGANELLPYVDFPAISQNPKIIASYSDGTTLLDAVTAKTGLCTYYGISPNMFVSPSEHDVSLFQSVFRDGLPPSLTGRMLVTGNATGRLIGGYDRNFCLLLQSPYLPLSLDEGYILFLEDHECFSPLSAVSAYLSHIGQSPLSKAFKGLVFGHYSDTPQPYLDDCLTRFGEEHHIPVLSSEAFGHHLQENGILPIGCEANLSGNGLTAVPFK